MRTPTTSRRFPPSERTLRKLQFTLNCLYRQALKSSSELSPQLRLTLQWLRQELIASRETMATARCDGDFLRALSDLHRVLSTEAAEVVLDQVLERFANVQASAFRNRRALLGDGNAH